MAKIIREPAELMALPVGAEAVDREGDYLRRDTLGWTYRPAGLPVLQADVMDPRVLARYMPMVVTTATVSAPTVPLDDPAVVAAVTKYLRGFYHELAVGHSIAARGVLSVIQHHTQKEDTE